MATLEQRQRNTAPKLSNVGYLPKIRYQNGVVTSFVFPDAEFFKENKDECCRVAAMYSFFLLGHSPKDDVYTVRYNPDTQEVCIVALETLLTDVFYGRKCYGSIYNVRQQDPETKDPKKDFEASVDRNYMLMKHGAEFTGVELPDSFYAKSTVYVTSDDPGTYVDDDDGEDSGDSDDGARKRIGVYHDNCLPIYGEVDENFSTDQIIQFLFMSADNNDAGLDDDCELDEVINNPNVDGAYKYFEAFEEVMDGPSATLVSKLSAPVSFEPNEICVCYMKNPNYESAGKLKTNCSTEYFNHLVFDFQESQLNVKYLNCCSEGLVIGACSVDAVLDDMVHLRCTGDLYEAEVNIEPLLSSDASFNHASCQCGHPRFELEQFSDLKRYLHLTCVTEYAMEKDGQMFMWTIYDGIVAL
jgi:hypothetical protein